MKSVTKKSKEVKNKPLFNSARTRIAKEINQQKNCKNVIKKELTKDQSNIYNQILDEEREKNKPKKNCRNH